MQVKNDHPYKMIPRHLYVICAMHFYKIFMHMIGNKKVLSDEVIFHRDLESLKHNKSNDKNCVSIYYQLEEEKFKKYRTYKKGGRLCKLRWYSFLWLFLQSTDKLLVWITLWIISKLFKTIVYKEQLTLNVAKVVNEKSRSQSFWIWVKIHLIPSKNE